MPPRTKKVIPVQPDYECGTCWYYESTASVTVGECLGTPPTVIADIDGEAQSHQPEVKSKRRGCVHWKARHTA